MALCRHLRILTGGIEERRMTPTIKVAFATSDRHRVDQHFGAASALLVYAVTVGAVDPGGIRSVRRLDRDGSRGTSWLPSSRCYRVVRGLLQAVGAPPSGNCWRLDSTHSGGCRRRHRPLLAALQPLCAAMACPPGSTGPSPASVIRPKAPAPRFPTMEAEGWQE